MFSVQTCVTFVAGFTLSTVLIYLFNEEMNKQTTETVQETVQEPGENLPTRPTTPFPEVQAQPRSLPSSSDEDGEKKPNKLKRGRKASKTSE
jgi:hypothetical protein